MPFPPKAPGTVFMMHSVAYRSDIFRHIDYHQTEGISYTDMEWVFHPMSEVRTCYYHDKPIYRYLVTREGQTCDPAVRAKHLNMEVQGLMKLLAVLGTIPKANPAYAYLESVIDYRAWTIYGMGLDKTATLNLDAFDEQLKRQFPEVYARATDFTLSVGLFGLKFHFVRAWRRVRSRRKLLLYPKYFLFCVMQHLKSQAQ